ncbi:MULTISPECIES: Wzz/FepE/Etk N-terminal domain-containing protein [unclassified Pseudoalteromonas]|uniref:Wzz/FepE/Etk N-terminal domain-containing protein n=1 Tax=unclassified Pseudoalteromonas TaxID=194690 RepID=UPI000517D9E2|nr:Wzz/FepE/Etk N-terminal domain-containing protein [Pseudoalteromonas sp. S3431]
MQKTDNQNTTKEQLDLHGLFSAIWKRKWLIISITAAFSVASVIYAISQPNIYKSEALLAPAEEEQSGGLGGLAGQFGGLASLAGVSLGGSSDTKTKLAIEVLKSRKFTTEFIQNHDALRDLMAAKSWNLLENKVIYDDEIYDVNLREWVREVEAPYKPKPSMQEAYKEFTKLIAIKTDKETGMVILSIEHVSPFIAQQWINWLVEDINKTMKARDVIEANKSTQFLTRQLEQTKIADIRAVLYKLVEEQAKTIMFAEVRDEYVFKTVDPALVPETKSKPKRVLIIILGTMIGAFFSIMIVLTRYFIKND